MNVHRQGLRAGRHGRVIRGRPAFPRWSAFLRRIVLLSVMAQTGVSTSRRLALVGEVAGGRNLPVGRRRRPRIQSACREDAWLGGRQCDVTGSKEYIILRLVSACRAS